MEEASIALRIKCPLKVLTVESNGKLPLICKLPSWSASTTFKMNGTTERMAPSSQRPFNGTGVLRIPGRKYKKEVLRIGTWNVRGMKKDGKVENIAMEMARLNVDILGISDTKLSGTGKFNTEKGKTVYYSGNDSAKEGYGVAIVVSKHVESSITNVVSLSNRVMMMQCNTKPRRLNIIQVYAPIADKDISEIDAFYADVNKLYQLTKKEEINIVMGDFNAKIGSGEVPGTVGKFGLGARNDRGDLLVQFCQEKELIVTNTMFQLPPRRLYTWTSPAHTKDHIVRNQIDYVILNHRFRNSIKSAKTYPGSDIGSDHNPVIVDFTCNLKYVRKKVHSKGIDVQKLKDPDVRVQVYNQVNEWAADNKTSSDPHGIWSSLKSRFSIINKDFICRSGVKKKQVWMTDEIIKLMEERRLHKTTNKTKYQELDRKIRSKCRFARLQWYESRCEKVELLMKRHDSFQLHKEIKDMASLHKKRRQTFLTDDTGNVILDPNSIKKCWEEYVENMFSDGTRWLMEDQTQMIGPSILESEVLRALQRAKTRKAPGPDEITCDSLKLLENDNVDALTNMFNFIYDSGEIPEDWLESVFVTLPKKTNARKCSDFRTISLMSHVLKLFLSIIHDRIRPKCDNQLGASQFGFRSGMGTREAQFALNVLVQKCRDMQQRVFLCFIDYEKAFDRVKHEVLMELLKDIDLDSKDLRIIRNLYWKQSATVRVDGELTNPVSIQKGVRQGCIMSPILFNVYSEAVIKKALEEVEHGIIINGQIINNLRYADDTVLMATTEEGLQEIVDGVSLHSKEVGLNMNVSKTKVMVISPKEKVRADIRVGNHMLENVDKYKYLGSWLTDTWESDTEIRTRIEIARAAFTNMRKVLCSRQLSVKLRTRLLQCYIWPVVLYGCEAWTMKAELRKKVEAFEMWSYRRMLRISWTDKVTNVEVLNRMGKKLELIRTIKQRKVAYLGHVLRHDRYQLLQTIMMGKIPGKRKVGRRKMSWLRNIREWTGIKTVEQLFRLALDKDNFKKLTANLQ